jgi:ADP-heptose:LPS heptosyltransferase
MDRYLVIQLARFGDILQTKRLIQGLLALPGSEVHLAVDAGLADLAGLLYPDVRVHALKVHGAGHAPGQVLGQCLAGCRAWRGADFTRVYNLNHSGCNHALAGLFDPDQVRGHLRHRGQVLRDPWVEMIFRLTAGRHVNPLNLMDFWGLFLRPALPPEQVNPLARPGGQGLGVVMAGRHARRSLPLPVLGRIVQAGAAHVSGPIYLLGTQAERASARGLREHIVPRLHARLRDLTGRTGWSELLEVVRGLDRLYTPDTGTMHLAAHLGTPVTAFFLSSAWYAETGPYGQGHEVWQAVPPCAPCLEARPCTGNLECTAGFSHPGFLARLGPGPGPRTGSGPGRDLPPGLCRLGAEVDDFGLDWRVLEGGLPGQEERIALREALRSHCLAVAPRDWGAEQGAIADLYTETDWMLHRP